jgi:DNA-binding transcriptional regulator YhcF (GntR family)
MSEEDTQKKSPPKKDFPLAQDRWLPSRDVASRLGIHLNTVSRIISRGELGKVLYLSKKDKRISESSLEKFIKSRLVG